MRLSGDVVLKDVLEYQDKATKEDKKITRIYLKASDPRDGATEISLPADIWATVEEGQKISFDVALGTRTFGTVTRLSVRFIGNLKVEK